MRFLALLLAAFLTLPAAADTVTVFAAASLKEALDANAKSFEAASGHKVVVSYAGSNALAKQIENGAPADLFISADTDWIDYIEKRNLVAPGSRKNLLGNELVLIGSVTPRTFAKIAPGINLGGAMGASRIAIANPDAVPAGKYAKAALVSLQMWAPIEHKVAVTENVRAALALVARGEARLGVVYRTDAMAEKNVRILEAFPPDSYPKIVYPMVTLRRATSPAVAAFATYLASPEAFATFEKFGFRAP
ncbi:molybdate ABC transporter substrate-binding protein [Usitatibacter palustris]|uniref:Molybdate-binding protein ModA n=1 Tax=Usitatibacter palustris TaxID=2732487 RepID=A0A6M4H2P6_9PROT|nr:molybdate ABC transporter substrate-binding protein [Usitatibacter palustris]QJR13602.1 Molybdate-binding protein ModA [Usitatibacter palustris]